MGRIVWAVVADRNGVAKRRPVVIVTPTSQINARDAFVVMAVTTTFADPAPPDHVELPWTNRGHPVTRLTRRSAAVIPWLATVTADDVEGFAGDVPAKQLREIRGKLDELDG
jgi:mRNA-degrading endonuclease toxin of MazEF toxin-antitoxin module